MLTFLSDAFSTITSSLPTIKISKWDVQVLKESVQKKQSDNFISSAISAMKSGIRSMQDTIAGIFQETGSDYESIAEFDSFVSFNGSHESQVVRNAVENGSFRSVNKIRNPDTIIVELAKGGYRSGIEAVLNALKKYQGSTTLCRVLTPFGVINNLNLVKLEYSYTKDNGSNLLIAKLHFQEIIGGTVKRAKNALGSVKLVSDTDTKEAGRLAPQMSTNASVQAQNTFRGNR